MAVTRISTKDRLTGRKVAKYRADWRDTDGKRERKIFATAAEANAHLASVAHAKNSGTYISPKAGQVTFGEYAAKWLDTKRATRKASTVSSYNLNLRTHILPAFGARPLSAIRRSDVQAWVNGLAAHLAPSTLRSVYGFVASIYREAIRDRLIPFTPCDRINLPAKVATKVSPLTPEQVHALADAIHPRYRALIITGAGTGLRLSELFGLTVDRVDFLRGFLTVDRQLAADAASALLDGTPVFTTPKTASSSRTVPIPRVVVEAVAAHLAEYGEGPSRLVFTNTGRGATGAPSSGGRVIRKSGFYETWKAAVKAAGLPEHTTPHDLRHTFASLLIAANENPKVIQSRLGHANISETFDTYGHLFPASEESTRAALDAALGRPADLRTAPSVQTVSTAFGNGQ